MNLFTKNLLTIWSTFVHAQEKSGFNEYLILTFVFSIILSSCADYKVEKKKKHFPIKIVHHIATKKKNLLYNDGF